MFSEFTQFYNLQYLKVGLPNRGNLRFKTPLLVSVVYVVNVNTPCTNSFGNQRISNHSSTHLGCLAATTILLIQLCKLFTVLKECFLKVREVLWTKQVHILSLHHLTPQVAIDVESVVAMPYSRFLSASVILQHKKFFYVFMPNIVEECSTTLPQSAL